MCIILAPVEAVTQTALFTGQAVRASDGATLTRVIYCTKIDASNPVAMVLPVPSHVADIRMLHLAPETNDLAKELNKAWEALRPKPHAYGMMRNAALSDGTAQRRSRAFAEIRPYGRFDVSIARDLDSIDWDFYHMTAAEAADLKGDMTARYGDACAFIIARLNVARNHEPLTPIAYEYVALPHVPHFVPTLHRHVHHSSGGGVFGSRHRKWARSGIGGGVAMPSASDYSRRMVAGGAADPVGISEFASSPSPPSSSADFDHLICVFGGASYMEAAPSIDVTPHNIMRHLPLLSEYVLDHDRMYTTERHVVVAGDPSSGGKDIVSERRVPAAPWCPFSGLTIRKIQGTHYPNRDVPVWFGSDGEYPPSTDAVAAHWALRSVAASGPATTTSLADEVERARKLFSNQLFGLYGEVGERGPCVRRR